MEEYIVKDHKKLRYGFTTGACAAAAAKAAMIMLFAQNKIEKVSLMTPKGLELNLKVVDASIQKNCAACAIQKDSGDDPDVTNGILVYAHITKIQEKEIVIDGGIGVGRVTKIGLEQPIGEAAINRVPRKMIQNTVEEILEEQEYPFGIKVIISIPEGIEIAKKTFNPKLGIEGGISVLGTSGIVEPMSEDAIKQTIHLEIKMVKASGKNYLLTTPGNYGEEFTKNILKLSFDKSVKCSNYVGDMIDYAVEERIEGILLVGHIGKLVKLAGGIMNTHSKNGDARMEILTAYVAIAGGNRKLLHMIMNAITTEEALGYIKEAGLLAQTMELIMERIAYHLNKRACGCLKIGVITFSNQLGLIGQTKEIEELLWYIS